MLLKKRNDRKKRRSSFPPLFLFLFPPLPNPNNNPDNFICFLLGGEGIKAKTGKGIGKKRAPFYQNKNKTKTKSFSTPISFSSETTVSRICSIDKKEWMVHLQNEFESAWRKLYRVYMPDRWLLCWVYVMVSVQCECEYVRVFCIEELENGKKVEIER